MSAVSVSDDVRYCTTIALSAPASESAYRHATALAVQCGRRAPRPGLTANELRCYTEALHRFVYHKKHGVRS